MKYKVLITTSGTGSRLGEMTKATNKCLLPIGGKPAMSYIIDNYPVETEFVVTLGHFGDQVEAALQRDYPQRTITFVRVDTYEGPGSSQGYSTLAAESALRCPFIFHACDTLMTDAIPIPNKNWVAGYELDDNAQYRTLNTEDKTIRSINDKGAPNFDYIHIGLVGVYDYESFWRHLNKLYRQNPANQSLNDTDVINAMIEEGKSFVFIPMASWHDTGNPIAFEQTRQALGVNRV